jgi:rhamnosyltransferase
MECHIHGPSFSFHGDNSYLDRLRALARDDLQYRFYGAFDRSELKDILAGLDVVVVPSVWWETYGITMREAMLAGVPVLATDLGAMQEALKPTGLDLLFRPGDADDLAGKLRALIENEELYRRASQLRSRVDGLDDVVDQIEAHYRAVVDASASRSTHQESVATAEEQVGLAPYVSVVIPTCNGGPLFERVLDKVLAQETSFAFEVLCIDSGSGDGTLDVIKARPPVRLITISQEAFNHGLTRNLGVREACGEIVVLLTQDAEPYDEHWLETLVGNLDDPDVAGAYCHQVPREDCNPFQRDRLRGWTHGDGLPEKRRLASPNEWDAMTPLDRLRLIAFDNVASCVRKSVMEGIPFEKRQFGEDLTWSRTVLQGGHATIMDPRAVVIHSHNRSIFYEFARVFLDHQSLHALVGLQTVPTLKLVLSCSLGYMRRLLSVVWRDDRGLPYRLWWMMKTPPYAFTQNLAPYLGAWSDIKGKNGFWGVLTLWLCKGV